MFDYRDGLADMPSYDVVERDWKIKINANECNMNLPPMVAERVMERLGRTAFNRYPNEQLDDLRDILARHYGLQRNNVLIGSGSSEIIEKLFYCFGGSAEKKIVYPWPSFSMYPIYSKAAQATGVPFALTADYKFDVEAYVRFVQQQKPALAVICNPNNPTGSLLAKSDVEYIAQNISCPFFVDEAYVEFSPEVSVADLLPKYPHMIVARTFSKAYGLAAIRAGYMLAADSITAMIDKSYMPYHMNVLTLVTAMTAFQMRDEFVPRVHMMIAERKRMLDGLQKLPGIKAYPSATNFILVHYDRAAALNEMMEGSGIGLRSFGQAPRLTDCLRISMGTREENDIWYKAMKDFVEERA
jgi:histidinol-phosphate aminotransferase